MGLKTREMLSKKKPQKYSISLCMVVKNEAMLLRQCLESVKSVVDEIVIVDTGSKDKTIKIAKSFGARIIHYKWDGRLGRARNVYIRNAVCPWILVLDADEAISRKDLPKLKKLAQDENALAYTLPTHNYTRRHDLLRDWHSNNKDYPEEEGFSGCPGWSATSHIRLFRKKDGVYYQEESSAHTDAIKFTKECTGIIKNCNVVIHHFQYLKGEKSVLKKQKDYLRRELNYIKTHRKNSWQYFNIGITFFNLRKDKLAAEYLKKAIQTDSKFDMAYLVLGMVYKEASKYKNAIFNLKKAIRINPRHADAWAVLGMTYEDKGELIRAKEALKKAIEIHPGHLLAHNCLGIVYEHSGNLKAAQREYKLAVKINPEFAEARYNLAALHENRIR